VPGEHAAEGGVLAAVRHGTRDLIIDFLDLDRQYDVGGVFQELLEQTIPFGSQCLRFFFSLIAGSRTSVTVLPRWPSMPPSAENCLWLPRAYRTRRKRSAVSSVAILRGTFAPAHRD
jgi:hypothetical protein